MSSFKKAADRKGLDPVTSEAFKNLTSEEKLKYGTAHQRQCEAVPALSLFPHEKSVDNSSNFQNARIVFTRDRPGGVLSGFGGRGDTQASAIDVVVGYQSANPRVVDDDGERILIDPDFALDAARIYISQKTEVDTNFVLAPQGSTIEPESDAPKRPTSAIAIKADNVRIIGREKIKLVTGTDAQNSHGGPILSVGGIELIAGNIIDSVQPMLLGENLTHALHEMVFHLSQLAGIVSTLTVEQKAFNEALANHWHNSPFYYLPTFESKPVQAQGKRVSNEFQNSVLEGIKSFKDSLGNYTSNFLMESGDYYIKSRLNSNN
tara:strand:- start:7423 stop:8382 length:960 start_codon:yes stop_codon:yes gene_type:complete